MGVKRLSDQMSKSWNSFPLKTVIFISLKWSPLLGDHGQPLLSPNSLLYCLPPLLNSHLKWNHSIKIKNKLSSKFNSQREMFFILSRALDKEQILSPHEEWNFRPLDSLLCCSFTEPQRLYSEWGLLSCCRKHGTKKKFWVPTRNRTNQKNTFWLV